MSDAKGAGVRSQLAIGVAVGGVIDTEDLTLWPAAVSNEMPTVLVNANPFVNSRLSAP